MKTKTTKIKSKKEIVLDGDNPQDYAEWETEMKFKIKTKLGAIGEDARGHVDEKFGTYFILQIADGSLWLQLR
jgi:hypothetical protein